MAGRQADRLAGWHSAWQAGWLAGWLAGWVSTPAYSHVPVPAKSFFCFICFLMHFKQCLFTFHCIFTTESLEPQCPPIPPTPLFAGRTLTYAKNADYVTMVTYTCWKEFQFAGVYGLSGNKNRTSLTLQCVNGAWNGSVPKECTGNIFYQFMNRVLAD